MSKNAKPRAAAPFTCSLSMSGTTGIITCEGEIGYDASPVVFCDRVDSALAAGATALTIRINSPGGICYDGLAMGDKLRNCGVPTTGIVIGSCMSMAGYLLQCCDKRIALPSATIMVHQPFAGLCGPVDELRAAADYFCRMRDSMFELMGSRCGMTGAEFSALHASTKYYTAAEALALGFIDEISTELPEPEQQPIPAAEQPAVNGGVALPTCGATVRLIDPRSLSPISMAAEAEEEPTEEEPTEEEPTEEEPTEEEPTEEEPTEEETTEEETTEEETTEEAEPEPRPVPAPEKEPAAYITRAEHLQALAEQESRIYARLGVPAASLPSPVASQLLPATSQQGMPTGYTRAQLDAMPSMARMSLLSASPALKHAYLTGGLK